ncbi:MAG: hypothetical protein KDM63_14555, partial [Verrucomicrobiae bacterium]|nr:hypothetical protein [Verrucomicrobiae bacterium]
MFKWILKKIIGSKNQRELKRIVPLVERTNECELALQKEADDSILKEKTAGWKAYLSRYHEDIELFNRRK